MEALEIKYCNVFVDGEDQYLFVRNLGRETSAQFRETSTQLVVHAQTGEPIVRKANKALLDEWKLEKQDPERHLFLIQAQARLRGVQPNLTKLLMAEDVPAPQKRGGRKLLYHRVKYFKFYNGGNLGDLRKACRTRSILFPPSLICKMIQQVVQGLSFMYAMDPYIIHGDAHDENIFLHWNQCIASEEPELEFFLGDFGRSTCGTIRAANRHGLPIDIYKVWVHTRELLGAEIDSGSQCALRQYLEAVIEPELRRLAHGPASLLPNLGPLLKLFSAAPATTSTDMRPFMITPESHSPPLPLLYNTWEEARNARGIHGPWHVAQVSINSSSEELKVVRISPSTYHRPTVDSTVKTDSESDEPEDMSSSEFEDEGFVLGRY